MVIVYWLIIVILGAVALFYRSKAKEFESLFELSKSYENTKKGLAGTIYGIEIDPERSFNVPTNHAPKLNKDGSIAKKRGRKPRHENMGNKK